MYYFPSLVHEMWQQAQIYTFLQVNMWRLINYLKWPIFMGKLNYLSYIQHFSDKLNKADL